MKIENLLIAMVLVGMFATGFGLFLVSTATTYNVPVSEDITRTFGNYNSTNIISESAISDLKEASQSGEANQFDIVEAIKSSLNVLKTVFIEGVPNALIMVTSITDFLPMPPFISRALMTIIIISVAFALVYLFLRYKNE